jgi:adenosyl cobinamide kinase/adenosyl cobinamide phosphate guanylyltransferase
MPLTLLLGGARSGKSSFAVEYGRRLGGAVVYVATAPSLDDDDLEQRIARHRAERPADWSTIEEPVELAAAIDEIDDGVDLVIVDCLTLWTSNLMCEGRSDEAIVAAADAAAERCRARRGSVITISNEVGLGVHPETPLGRRYRDVLGLVNQRWAAAADDSLLMVAGRALRLHSPAELLDLPPSAVDLA